MAIKLVGQKEGISDREQVMKELKMKVLHQPQWLTASAAATVSGAGGVFQEASPIEPDLRRRLLGHCGLQRAGRGNIAGQRLKPSPQGVLVEES